MILQVHRVTAVHPRVAALALTVALAGNGCLYFTDWAPGPGIELRTAPSPSDRERYCAWYGDAHDGVLYFGEAAFWSAYAAHGEDPTGDLREPGPQRIGRFDLVRRELLAPLDVTPGSGARSGVWDVLATSDGRIWFTTFFEHAGWIDSAGEVRRLRALGTGLNELAPGPEGGLLVSRYAGEDGADGSVLWLDADGGLRAELPLSPLPGYRVAAKSVAWDPARREIWVNTDLLPRTEDTPAGHDVRVLDTEGRELARSAEPEVQFMAFAENGTGFAADVDAAGLWLRVMPPGAAGPPLDRGERIRVDPDFARALDFVQDIQIGADGRALATTWSGAVHVVDPSGPLIRTLRLPRLGSEGIFYTAVPAGPSLCATLCDRIQVVCRGAGER